jgi:hypothetical protein
LKIDFGLPLLENHDDHLLWRRTLREGLNVTFLPQEQKRHTSVFLGYELTSSIPGKFEGQPVVTPWRAICTDKAIVGANVPPDSSSFRCRDGVFCWLPKTFNLCKGESL